MAQRETGARVRLPRSALGQSMLGLTHIQHDDIAVGLALMQANHEAAVRHSFLAYIPTW
jgi:hypothetical protein